MTKRDCIDTFTFSKDEMLYIADLGLKIKEAIKAGYYPQLLKHKNLGMIFDQVSTRTRISAETAINELGGSALYLAPGQIQLGEDGHEGLDDTGRILGRLVDIIGIRTASHQDILDLAKYSQAPVVNFMSDDSHPTQAIGDLVTIKEYLPQGKKLEEVKIVFVGDANQIALTTMYLCAQMGMHFVQYGPKSNQVPADVLAHAREIAAKTGATIDVSNDEQVLEGADFVYTDTWVGPYDNEVPRAEYMKIFYPKYQVDDDLMRKTNNPDVKFMHCLPATRGEEVTGSVLDGKSSIAWEQAENKKTAMRALFVFLLNPDAKVASAALAQKYQGELDDLLTHKPLQ